MAHALLTGVVISLASSWLRKLLTQVNVGSTLASVLKSLPEYSQREAFWDREEGSWLSCP